MKTREICQLFLSKSDKSFVRNCVFENMIRFKSDFALKCMNIERDINLTSSNFLMEDDLISLFEKACDKHLCQEFMSEKAKNDNATTIFTISYKVDKIASEKLTEDCYNWFSKSLMEKMVALFYTMTIFSEKEWDVYLLGKPVESRVNIGEFFVYSLLVLWSVKTLKTFVKDIVN
jgi:hypothetical protein